MDDRILIEARRITKTFPGVRALDNVDLELRAGETLSSWGRTAPENRR